MQSKLGYSGSRHHTPSYSSLALGPSKSESGEPSKPSTPPWGSGFGFQGSGFRFQGLGFRV